MVLRTWHATCIVNDVTNNDCEKNMNTMTKLLNALAFANVSNLNEFNALLRQVDLSPASRQDPVRRGPASVQPDAPSAVPGIRHAQSAM